MAESVVTKELLYDLYRRCREYGHYYHDLDSPIVPDEVYDDCMQEIKRIENMHPEWVRSDSPLKYVSGKASKVKLSKVKHPEQMQSLDDKFSIEEVSKWFLGLQLSEMVCPSFDVEAKIDGLSVALEYKNGKLVNGSTRGDGWIGEDVTENLMRVKGIPLELDSNIIGNSESIIRVRAEVVMYNDDFSKINSIREAVGDDVYANPRNAAAGLLRTIDIKAVENGLLTAIAFNVLYTNVEIMQNGGRLGVNQVEDLEILEQLGFNVVPHYKCDNFNEIKNAINEIEVEREKLPYWADGAVIKVNSRRNQNNIGVTTKYPKWAVAYKYKSEEKNTRVVDITTQTGRTGVITPKVEFEPIELGGTIVRYATLHNQGYIDAMGGIVKGDEITVNKAAEIIPQVLRVNLEKRDPKARLFRIDFCSSCGSPAVFNDNEIQIAFCKNINCPAQKNRYFEFIASREILNIEGLGSAVIDKLVREGMLNKEADIFQLERYREKMIGMAGLGEKKVSNILRSINNAKHRPLNKIIASLGIQGCGISVGKVLEKNYSDLYAISKASREELIKLNGIGEKLANFIVDFFSNQANIKAINELEKLGVNIRSNEFLETEDNTKKLLKDKSFVITGTLNDMSRNQAVELIESNGGKVQKAVSGKTDYLIMGKNAGEKLNIAQKLGIKIITEIEFLKLLDA